MGNHTYPRVSRVSVVLRGPRSLARQRVWGVPALPNTHLSTALMMMCVLTAIGVSERLELATVINRYGNRVWCQEASGVIAPDHHSEHLVRVTLTLLVVKDGD